MEEIIEDIIIRARDYDDQFGILDYIENKGLKFVIEPYFKKLEQQLKESNEVLKGVVDDLYTPYRLGLGELPNPQWTNLNKARNYLTKYKVKE